MAGSETGVPLASPQGYPTPTGRGQLEQDLDSRHILPQRKTSNFPRGHRQQPTPPSQQDRLPVVCHQVSLNAPICHQVSLNAPICHQVSLNAHICHQVSLNAPICHQVSLNAPICDQVSNASIYHQVSLNAPICHQVSLNAPIIFSLTILGI